MARVCVLILWFAVAPAFAADPPNGAIVVVGGGTLPAAVRAEFVSLAGGKKAKVVVIPTASERADDPREHEAYLKPWKAAGAASVVLLHARDAKAADQPEFVKPLQDATAVWFSGGDQSRLTKAYANTRTLTVIRERYAAGAVVGGTSAGAAVLSDVMITGGTTVATTADGFGLLKNCVIDQHFTQRNRTARLAGVVAAKPGTLGVGIDEGTAVVVTADAVKVLGDGAVYFSENGGQPVKLAAGDRYDWAKRKKLD